MKNLLRSTKKWLLVFAVLLQFKSLAQPILDQQSIAGGTNLWVGAVCAIQSFKPGVSGPFASLDLQLNSAGVNNATVELVSGVPPGGVVLGTVTVPAPAGTNWVNFRLPTCGPNLTAGNDYYIRLSGSVNWLYAGGNPYANGMMYQCAASSFPTNDLNFKTYMYNGACTPPTPGSNQTGILPGTPSAPLGVNVFGLTGVWTSTGSGSFSNTFDPNATYTPSCADAATVVTLTWTSCCNTSQTCNQTISVSPNVMTVNSATVCAGGTATLTATGAIAYSWSANAGGATTSSVNLSPGTTTAYTVSGTFGNGCVVNQFPIITVNPVPTVSAPSATICNGSTATLSASAAGGTPVYNYNWFNVPTGGTTLATSQNYTTPVLAPGVTNYYPQVTDANGCVSTRPAVPVTVNALPAVTSANAITICTGQTLGLNLTSNQSPVTYQWIAGNNANVSGESTTTQTTGIINNTLVNLTGVAQTVTYTVTPTNTTTGCVGNQIVTITINAAPVATADPDITVCEGDPLTINATAGGGVAPYSYNWFDAPSAGMLVSNTQSYNVTTTPPGVLTYYIEATGANGCVGPRDPINITVNQRPTIMTVTGTDITCFGANDGQITGTSSNGTAPYEYSYTGAAPFFPNPITGLSAGNYTLYTRDVNGCISSNWQTGNVSEPSQITLSIASQTNVDCFGNNTGSISVSSFGGTGSIEYSINGSPYLPSSFFTNLTAGSYTITAKDINNCLSTPQIVNITEPSQLNLNYTGTLSTCSGVPLNITLSATGGTGGYNYSWVASDNVNTSGESTSANFTTLVDDNIINSTPSDQAVNYTLTVTDANSCVATHTPFFTINGTPTITNVLSGSTCSGVSFSQILGASQPCTFQWVASNNPNTPDEETTLQFTNTLTDVVTNPTATAENIFYSLTPISSPEGCVGTSSTFTLTVNPLPTITVSATPSTICEGGTSTFNASGANTYSWNPAAFLSSPAIPNPTFGGASAGAHTYTVTGTNTVTTCSNNAILNITVNATPGLPTLSTNSPVCAGGTLNLTTPAIASAYSWSGPNAFFSNVQNPSIVGISTAGTGTYSLTITSASGCSSPVATIGVTINQTPTVANAGVDQNLCASTATLAGNIPAIGTGTWSLIAGTGTITTPSSASSGITGLTPGIATFRWTISSGVCAASSDDVTINVSSNPTPSNAGSDQVLCNLTTASLSANNPGVGTGAWSVISGSAVVTTPSSATSGVTGLTIGASSTLRWTITSGTCPSSTDDVVITSNPNPTISGSLSACTGNSSSLTGTGTPHGTTPWTSSAPAIASVSSVGLVTGIVGGTTNITYMDINGCSTVSTFTVNNTPPASITAGGPTTFCSGGSVLLSANVGAYTYQWMSGVTPIAGETASTYNAINAGNHTVVITDIGTGCNATSNMININIDALPSGTVSTTDVSCNGAADGFVTVTPSGTGPFMFSYNNGAYIATASQSGLVSGSYTVNVQSGAGCISSDILYNINEPTAITGSLISTTNPTCSGSIDGSATVNAVGGNGIYNYNLNGGTYSPSNNFTGLIAGVYNVNIQDGNGCLSSVPVNFSLFDPSPVSVGMVTTNVNCFGASTGSINASGSGGAGGYQYSLDNIVFQGATMFTGLSAGAYTVYCVDAMGCTGSSTTSISQPPSNFLVTSSGLSYICSGGTWGETFNSSGGFGAITYSWVAQPPTNVTGASSGSGNTINEILTATTSNPNAPETVVYDLYATDQNGCSATTTHTVYVHPLPPVNIVSDVNPLCVSSVANLTASSTSDFFGWNPTTDLTILNNTNATFTPSAAGNFVVTYTVAMNTGANCTNSGAITLTVTTGPSVPSLTANSPICAGSSIYLTSNTVAGATYSWIGPNGFTSTLEDPTIPVSLPADAGTYTCTIDVTGCTSSSTVNVVINSKPQAVILGVSTTFCANETFTLDGSNSIHNSSSITNYQWQLNGVDIPGANLVTYTGNTPGNYKLVVTNDLGCMDTTFTPNIANADPIPTPVINGATSFCTGNTVTLDALASSAGGASTIANYEWLLNGASVSTGASNNSYVASLGGDYQLIVLNSNGCKDTTVLYTVTENPIPSLPSVTPDPINVCVGSSTNVSVNSPVVGSTYTWASINAEASVSLATGTSNTVNGLTAGIASITLTETNSSGCTGPTYSVTVNVNNPPIASASFTSNDTICYNGNASVTLNTITGGTYSWNSSIGLSSALQSVTFTNITNSGNIQFYGTITDPAGCVSLTDTINLFVQNQPTVPVISNASSVCPGQAFTLNVSPIILGADYYWTDPSAATQNGINLTSITIPVATAITAGPYVVNYIDPQGCTSSSSALYNQPLDPTPIVNISGVSTICSGNSTVLSASTSIGIASAYQWFNNGVAIGGATSATYNVSSPGVYNVEIILSTGCMDSAAIGTTVNVSSGPTVIANPTSSSVCAGNSATISASGAVTYSWDTGATTPSITVNPTTTTSYIVTGTDASGCTNSDTAVVIVNALPAAPSITSGSTAECAGTNVSLSSSSTLTNTWINTSTLAVIGTTQNISHTETIAGVYNYGVYVTDANSCNSATATIAITFNSCLTNLISDNVSTNANTPVSGNFLTNDGSPSIFTTVSIINGPANGAITVSSNGNFTYTPNTNFSGYNMVIVQVCDVTPTCLNDTIYIVVNPNIVGDIYTVNGLSTPNTIIGNVLVNDAGLGISGNVILVNSVTNGIMVIDSLGNFTYTPNAGFCGTDLFTYNVCDQNGLCANAGVNLIVTCDSTVTTTTGFSPNGDGVNDNWVIQGIETTQNTVTVFDRWGNQVISFTNYNNTNTAWDGKNSNGVELPAGTYFYSIDIPNEKSKKGWVEITK